MMRTTFLLLAISWPLVSLVNAAENEKLVDMTYSFEETTLHWPTAKPFRLEKVNEGMTPGNYWYASYNYGASEHVGTHLDAPFHFAQGKWTTDQIPLSRLIGPAVILDIQRRAKANRDYLLQVSDILGWEKRHGRIPGGALAFLYSGWGRLWGHPEKYFGSDNLDHAGDLHFPGVSEEAGRFLVKQRRVSAVGTDTPSIDHGPSRDFITHRVLGEANIPVFENVANLDQLPPKGARVFAIPMKIKGGTGGPLRIFAILP